MKDERLYLIHIAECIGKIEQYIYNRRQSGIFKRYQNSGCGDS